MARLGRPAAERVMGLERGSLGLGGEGEVDGAAGDDGLGGGAGGGEGEVWGGG